MLYWATGLAFLFVCVTQGPAVAFGLAVLCVGLGVMGGR
jgi:hypothetical protein